MQQLSTSVQLSAELSTRNRTSIVPDQIDIDPVRAIAIILARGVLRLQQRQTGLAISTEESVHRRVLATTKEAP